MMRINNWYGPFKRGCRALSKHKVVTAINELRYALELCPVTEPKQMAHILYFLGLALDRSGQSDLAVKSWVNARRLVRSGYVASLCSRWINGYGMRKSGNPQMDDYRAFKYIQVFRYLSKKVSGHFCSDAERDVVYAIIEDAWKLISKTRVLCSLSCSQKMAIFKKAKLDFPYMYIEDALKVDHEPIIGNFRHRTTGTSLRLTDDDPCSCGSGLPWRMCCGGLHSLMSEVHAIPRQHPR